jgi:hypothetical protein
VGLSSSQPNYYEILYAFLVDSANYRSAAKYMYHLAVRIERECDVSAIAVLRRQSNALLAVIHALELVPNHKWIMIEDKPDESPALPLSSPSSASSSAAAGEFKSFGDSSREAKFKSAAAAAAAGASDVAAAGSGGGAAGGPFTGALKLVDLQHIKRRYCLCLAHLELALVAAQTKTPFRVTQLSPKETVLLLLQAGLMDLALSIVLQFDLDVALVIDGLVDKCLALQLSEDPDSVSLVLDDRPPQRGGDAALGSGPGVSAGAPCAAVATRASAAWDVLRRWLIRFDGPSTNYALRLSVMQRLLSSHARTAVPPWLLTLITRPQPPPNADPRARRPGMAPYEAFGLSGHDLSGPVADEGRAFARDWANVVPALRLLVKFDLIDEAVHLALQYLSALRERAPLVAAAGAGDGGAALRMRPGRFGTQVQIKAEVT